ncbi:MAG: type II toxin-antitoxin system VapB family antitoxin [Geminicoccaceae bacterium]
MPLYIRDDRVKELAGQVAALERSTVTDAVRDALERRLQQLQDERDERRRRIDEVLARFDAEPDRAPGFTDKDLYDDNGDPIA